MVFNKPAEVPMVQRILRLDQHVADVVKGLSRFGMMCGD
jgi:hypothetical protein